MPAPGSIELRALGPDDVGPLRALLRCFAEAFAEPATYLAAPPSPAYLRDLLGSECFVALVATADDEVVGGLTAYELRKPERERSEIYIYDLAVAEAYRRRGIAGGLIRELKRVARGRGAWVIFVQADPPDAAAVALYSKLGAREEVLHFDIPVE